MIGYNRLSTPADLAPSFLNQIALRKLRWIPLAKAHTPVCSTRDLVCARPRTATWRFLKRMGAWHVESRGLPTHPMNAYDTGEGQRGDYVLIVLQCRALVKKNLLPTVGD
jgi:hypothetical protein